jgi:two-component system KDP operon response regulator KdpE
MNPTILLVEDEPEIRHFLRVALEGFQYHCLEAPTGTEGEALAARHHPGAILLDLGLPDMDGLAFLTRLREWSRIPVLVITARGREVDKVAALESGADDFLTKPFSSSELLARLRAILQHGGSEEPESPLFVLDRWRVDLPRRQVLVDGQEVHLTPFEFGVFSSLIRHAGRVVTYRQLLLEVWGDTQGAQLFHLRIYMTQLRHKLELEPSRPRYLQTEPGVGYRLATGGAASLMEANRQRVQES